MKIHVFCFIWHFLEVELLMKDQGPCCSSWFSLHLHVVFPSRLLYHELLPSSRGLLKPLLKCSTTLIKFLIRDRRLKWSTESLFGLFPAYQVMKKPLTQNISLMFSLILKMEMHNLMKKQFSEKIPASLWIDFYCFLFVEMLHFSDNSFFLLHWLFFCIQSFFLLDLFFTV